MSKKFRHPAGVAIRKGLDAARYRRSPEGKAEKKARKEHNEMFGYTGDAATTDKKTQREIRKRARQADAARGALMRARGGTFKGTF